MVFQTTRDLLTNRPWLDIKEPGEQFRICCPFCHDTRFRLYISHMWGQRDSTVREVALLLRLPATGDAPTVLWSGLGNARESRAELCRIETFTTFRVVDDHTLERASQVRATFDAKARAAGISRAERREMQKKCVTPDPQPEPQRFPLAPP